MNTSEPRTDTSDVTRDGYTPVSGLAVAALGTSVLAVILIVAVAITARSAGKPAYQPVLLIPAFVGFVLAVGARWNIKRSQGARTGLGFTTVALWLSGLGGACYAAYMVTTELAIRGQARDFTEQWFAKVTDAPLEASFLFAIDPDRRRSIDEKDLASIQDTFGVMFYAYRDHKVVRLLRDAGKEKEIIPRGIKGWEYTAAGSVVQQLFDIRTREGVFHCVVSVLGQDKPALGGRVWQVLLNRVEVQDWNTTEYGRLLLDTQFDTTRFIREWAAQLNRKEYLEAFVETLPLAERSNVNGLAETPAYQQFRNGSLIQVEGREPTPEERAKYSAVMFRENGINPLPGSMQMPVGAPRLDFVNDGLRITQMIELNAEMGRPVVAYIVMDVVGDQLRQRLKELRAMDWRQLPILPAPTAFDAPNATDRFKERGFRIVAIDVQPRAARLAPTGRQ